MGYKILGFAVWNGAKWYLRRRYGVLASRRAMAVGVVGVAVVALAVGSKRSPSS
ncbi:MAG TPA: hypothetical protein VGM33_03175 [Baekduia sp.]|jgi:hypothetical protein